MSTPVQTGQAQGSVLHDETGKITEGHKMYGGTALPPGAVPVTERILARWVQPGTQNEPHGVPPIGIIGLPTGWIMEDLFDDQTASIRVLPFRFPWHSRAYALRCGDRLCAIIRNVQAMELAAGHQVVVQLNDSHDWASYFGRVRKLGFTALQLDAPDGTLHEFAHEQIHFTGKLIGWWDQEAEDEVG